VLLQPLPIIIAAIPIIPKRFRNFNLVLSFCFWLTADRHWPRYRQRRDRPLEAQGVIETYCGISPIFVLPDSKDRIENQSFFLVSGTSGGFYLLKEISIEVVSLLSSCCCFCSSCCLLMPMPMPPLLLLLFHNGG
jgi:hypothetical protein